MSRSLNSEIAAVEAALAEARNTNEIRAAVARISATSALAAEVNAACEAAETIFSLCEIAEDEEMIGAACEAAGDDLSEEGLAIWEIAGNQLSTAWKAVQNMIGSVKLPVPTAPVLIDTSRLEAELEELHARKVRRDRRKARKAEALAAWEAAEAEKAAEAAKQAAIAARKAAFDEAKAAKRAAKAARSSSSEDNLNVSVAIKAPEIRVIAPTRPVETIKAELEKLRPEIEAAKAAYDETRPVTATGERIFLRQKLAEIKKALEIEALHESQRTEIPAEVIFKMIMPSFRDIEKEVELEVAARLRAWHLLREDEERLLKELDKAEAAARKAAERAEAARRADYRRMADENRLAKIDEATGFRLDPTDFWTRDAGCEEKNSATAVNLRKLRNRLVRPVRMKILEVIAS